MAASSAQIESMAGRQMLRNEMLRAGLHVVAMVAMIVVALLLIGPGGPAPLSEVNPLRAMAPFLGLALYEGLVFVWLWRRGVGASRGWFRYANTFLEMCVPTLTVLALGHSLGIAQSLMGAAPWLYFVLIVFTALYLDPRLCVLAGAWAAAQFSALSYVATQNAAVIPDWEVLTFWPAYGMKAACLVLMGVASAFVAWQIRQQLNSAVRSTIERSRAISIFGQHVSPQVAEMLLNQPVKDTGEERTVCVMFFDIRDFSIYAAQHTPSEVMEYLNALFCELIAAVNAHDGIVNKFLGDGFMAVFGAPLNDGHPCVHAVDAAKEIVVIIDRLNREGRIPPTRVGLGLHLGEAITGNIGSPERREYTIIGDVVNLASRIEQATKLFNAQILVSEQVMAAIDADRHPAEDLGWVDLKGQSKASRLYRLKTSPQD